LTKKFLINEKSVVITGGAGLLGSSFVEAILEIKGIPIILDNDKKKCIQIIKNIKKKFSIICDYYCVDITNEKAIKSTLSKILKNHNNLYGLINNAGINDSKGLKNNNDFESYDIQKWNRELNVNLTGTFVCSKIFGSHFAKKKNGVIVNISSDLGIISPDQRLYKSKLSNKNKPISYSVSKHGIIGLTKYLATYWASKGIRCNALSPGGIKNNQPKEFLNKINKLIPMNRMANVNEYKSAIQFLCSDASSYMNGANLVIDGGRTIW
tara:strand:+ start:425 stop:1225 length:801 start_codon:yes stop_codon:yes gene_type:complete